LGIKNSCSKAQWQVAWPPYSETVDKNGTEILYLMCHPFQPLVVRGKGTRQHKCYRFKPSKQPYFLLLFQLIHFLFFSFINNSLSFILL
jgi:hypothetical protein